MKNINYLIMIGLCLVLSITPEVKSEGTGKYFSVISENDIYAPKGQDRHYSNGLRFGFGLNPNGQRPWYTLIGKLLKPSAVTTENQYEIAVGHNIYTPENFLESNPIPNDRPFAGWLFTELTTVTNSPGTEQALTASIGLVGPAALGEEIQKFNHSIINDPKPQGWDNQLRNEPTLLVKYRQSWFYSLSDDDNLSTGIIARTGVNLGNVFTDIGVGLVLRAGNHLPEQELPLRIQPGLSGNISYFKIRDNQTNWQIYVEAQGRGVARNLFLDGNTFADSLSVAKKHFVYDLGGGLTMGFGQFKYPVYVSFSLLWRSREFELQQGRNSFGSAQIGIQY